MEIGSLDDEPFEPEGTPGPEKPARPGGLKRPVLVRRSSRRSGAGHSLLVRFLVALMNAVVGLITGFVKLGKTKRRPKQKY